jgi:hypothetical protein
MINQEYYALIELVLFGAIALGIGIWQLWSVNRDIARSKAEEDRKDPPA